MKQKHNIEVLINIIQDSLTDDLLKPKYRIKNKNRFWGHCYVATETLYHLLDCKTKEKYRPAILRINDDTHWFLKNVETGKILDITKEQFNFDLSYDNARNCAFLTKTPSKRSLILINRIYEKIGC